jgi:hypothetical protein
MSPERVADLVRRWVRLYTRDLPAPLAERRIAELDADLYDHIAYERAAGIPDRRIARSVASRLVRGLAADAAWRRRIRLTTKEDTEMSRELRRSVVRVAIGVAIVTSLPLIAMQFSDDVVWSLADFVLVAAFLTIIGVGIELAIRGAGGLGTAAGLAALGVAAALFGGADDAPGLVLLGLVLIGTACVLGVRTMQHSRG